MGEIPSFTVADCYMGMPELQTQASYKSSPKTFPLAIALLSMSVLYNRAQFKDDRVGAWLMMW